MTTARERFEMSKLNGKLLLVDDDKVFCDVLGTALSKRGFDVVKAHDTQQAQELAEKCPPQFVVLDLSMPECSGLTLIEPLKKSNSNVRIVMLTSYASIATAVEAIKLGATQYLTKPADANQVVQALATEGGNPNITINTQPMSAGRAEWEHIQRVLVDCNGNISEAARRLGMHRRTLQRKLNKRPLRR
jgi:two-component system, response regulator RegA